MIKEKVSKVLNWWGLQNRIWWLLWKLHLDGTRRMDSEHPSAAMLESRDFFRKNEERVKRVANMFEDRLSQKIFLRQIEYRQTYNRNLATPYNMKDQYFPEDLIKISRGGGIFVDCGAFIGDTAKAFIRYSGNSYRRIVCFEPDPCNIRYLMRWSKSKDNIVIYDRGTWSYDGDLCFEGIGGSGSRIVDSDVMAQKISVVALDSVPECQDATFIKMDIEGAEYETLRGATRIIKKNRPILAICIYHSDEDMLRIAELIKTNWPEYRLYVRQHFFLPLETVLYAIP